MDDVGYTVDWVADRKAIIPNDTTFPWNLWMAGRERTQQEDLTYKMQSNKQWLTRARSDCIRTSLCLHIHLWWSKKTLDPQFYLS